LVNETAEPVAPSYLGRIRIADLQRLLLCCERRLMTKWAMLVVVGDEFAENRSELPAMEYRHRVESLPHQIGGDAAHMDPRGVEIDGGEHVETMEEST
jgi:hypothetical protein